ncbi:MAG: ZIP family metal transporter [Candidatus Korarchaeota archaeon]|nr:ZIP family metal transporter [Candidatus Korarchaeota archaeon]
MLGLRGGGRLATALLMGGVAALLTTLGSAGVLLVREPERLEHSALLMDVGMAFSSGVMLVAAFTSLLLPAISMAGVNTAMGGFVLGAFSIYLANRYIPHEHLVKGYEGPEWGARKLRAAWLVALALIIHNFPEGMAVGVAFGSGDLGRATALATAIGIQNVPEGLAVSAPLVREGYGGLRATVYGALTGLVEPVGGLIGALAVTRASAVLPMAMGLAAGAMIFVVSDEMIPESHRKGHERWATAGVILGFALMMFLDSSFG